MSHHTLQQLVVRMLFDEAFTSEVYADPGKALEGEDLTDVERDQLLAVDRRAWRYDALRRKRTLRTLAEEYKVSTTMVLAETRSLASLESFFSGPFFHRAVRDRGSICSAFGEFLHNGISSGQWKAPQIPDIVRLEATMAECRRVLGHEGEHHPSEIPLTICEHTVIRLAPGFGVGSFQRGIIETVQRVEKYLFELSLVPAMALCDDAPQLTGLPEVDRRSKSYLMFSPGAKGITLSHIDKPTFLVLFETKRRIEIGKAIRHAADAGVRPEQTKEILAHWIESGALMITVKGE